MTFLPGLDELFGRVRNEVKEPVTGLYNRIRNDVKEPATNLYNRIRGGINYIGRYMPWGPGPTRSDFPTYQGPPPTQLPSLWSYLPSPGEIPKYQASTTTDLGKQAGDYIRALNEAMGYKPIEDYRQQGIEALNRLYDIQEQRAGSLLAQGAQGSLAATKSLAVPTAMAQTKAEFTGRRGQALTDLEKAYSQLKLAERESLGREALSGAQLGLGEKQAAYQAGLLPFQYRASIGAQEYGLQQLLPAMQQYQSDLLRAYTDYLTESGIAGAKQKRIQDVRDLVAALLGGAAGYGLYKLTS